jgi:hypothetical protein
MSTSSWRGGVGRGSGVSVERENNARRDYRRRKRRECKVAKEKKQV